MIQGIWASITRARLRSLAYLLNIVVQSPDSKIWDIFIFSQALWVLKGNTNQTFNARMNFNWVTMLRVLNTHLDY